MEKHFSSDVLCDVAEAVFKNNIFNFGKKTKQKKKKETAIGMKFALIVFCLWQTWKMIFFKKYGGGVLMKYSSFGNMEKKN